MQSDPEWISDQLNRAAEQGAPVPIDVDGVVARVGRRRSRRRLGAAAAACAAVVGAGIGAYAVVSPGTAASPYTASSPGAEPSTPATGNAGSDVVKYTCGERINLLTSGASTADGGVKLSISKVERAAGGEVQVTVTLTPSQRRTWPDSLGPTAPRFVVVRDGVVVAGQNPGPIMWSTVHPTLRPLPLRGVTADPQHPYSLVLDPLHNPGTEPVPCPGYTWDELWRHGAQYEIVAFVSDWELDTTPRTPDYTPGSRVVDPLLSVEEPLVPR